MEHIRSPQSSTTSQGLNTRQMEIFHLCNQNQSAMIYEMIHEDLLVVCDAIPALLASIKFCKPSDPRGEICFDVLYTLIENFGIPIAILLNDNYINELKMVANGWQDLVTDILKSCLRLFSSDLQEICIKDIMSLAKKFNIQPYSVTPSPNETNSATFISLFRQAKKVLSDYEEASKAPNFENQKLTSYIRGLVKEINSKLENDEMNDLEENLMTTYNSKLIAILRESGRNLNSSSNLNKPSYPQFNNTYDNYAPVPKKEGKTPEEIRFRTNFVLGEILSEDESHSVEYKDYPYPFEEVLLNVLRKTINGFLNRRGGRIYIGIDDDRVVRGIQLLSKDRDNLKQQIYMMIKAFEPPIKNDELVSTHFIPVLNSKDGEVVPGFFVVKIIVKQGDPKVLYSELSHCFQAWIRNDAQVLALSAREIAEQIWKRQVNPGLKVPDSEFDDPKPDPIKDAKEGQLPSYGAKKEQFKKVNIQPQSLKGKPVNNGSKPQSNYANQASYSNSSQESGSKLKENSYFYSKETAPINYQKSQETPYYNPKENAPSGYQTLNLNLNKPQENQHYPKEYAPKGYQPEENQNYKKYVPTEYQKPQDYSKEYAPSGHQNGHFVKPQENQYSYPKEKGQDLYQNVQQGNYGNQNGKYQQAHQAPAGKQSDLSVQQSKNLHWKEKYKIDPSQKVFRVDLEGLDGMDYQQFNDLIQATASATLACKLFLGQDKLGSGNAFAAFDTKDKAEKFMQNLKKTKIKINKNTINVSSKLVVI